MSSTEDFIEKETRAVAKLREDVFEFQGFEREFLHFQEQMLRDYEKSSSLKHPVNKGDAREDYLKQFLSNNGLIAKKFGISKLSSRVVASTGHHSEEIDILFYDYLNSISLLKHQSSEFYPVEWVHGVIQVKSCLRNKKTIKDGLKNIASFKRLKKSGIHINKFNGGQITSNTTRGFGILFAYKATLKWGTIIDAIKEFMKDSPSTEWPNAIVILDLGMIVPFNKEENIGCEFTQDIDKLKEIDVIGIPNRGDCLLRFYSTLTKLLNRSQLGGFDFWDYIRLPFTSGEISYSFTHGQFSETGNCKIHGKYLRSISQDALKKILSVCENAEPINWIKATDIAYGKKGDNIEAYLRRPGDVLIYNPDNEQLSDILIFKENSAIAFDFIDIEGKQYWIPYYYSIKDNLVTVECPKCKKSNKLFDDGRGDSP